MKKHCNTLSLQQLTSHQQRIRAMLQKINSYSPTFHINRNYNRSRIIQKIQQQREQYEDKIFEENMNIIQRLESVGSKVDRKHFPPVDLQKRSKRKVHSLSGGKLKPAKQLKACKIKTQDEIFEENLQMIDKIESTEKKIQCWQDKSLARSRLMRQKLQKKKRNQILQKFKDISLQLSRLKVKKSNIRSNVENGQNPYINHRKRTTSQASFQTNANSFKIKK